MEISDPTASRYCHYWKFVLECHSMATLCRLRGIPCAIFAHCDVYDYVRIRCSSTVEFALWKMFLWTLHAFIHRVLRVPTLSRSQAMVPLLRATGCGPLFFIVPGGADHHIFQCWEMMHETTTTAAQTTTKGGGQQRQPAEQPTQRTPNSLLFVGRINKEKNIQQLLEIMVELGSDYTLTMVGRVCQDDFGTSEAFQSRLPPNVRHVGEIPHGHDKLVEMYNRHEAFLFAAEYDTFGNVIIEALLCGCIPIVKDCLGPGEIVQHVQNGLKWKTTAEAVACIRDKATWPALSDVIARGHQYSIQNSYRIFTQIANQIVAESRPRQQAQSMKKAL